MEQEKKLMNCDQLKKCIVGVVKSCVVDEIVKITKMVVVG
jgi:hypothetical protein